MPPSGRISCCDRSGRIGLRSGVGNFHVILESLPGIVTSHEGNLLKPEVCNNLRLVAENCIKNIQEIDLTMVKSMWRLTNVCKKAASVTGIRFSSFYTIF